MNLMSPHILSKKVGQSNKRLEKEVVLKKKQVKGRFPGTWVSNMSGYKKSNLESFSEGKMGRGLLIWKKTTTKKLHLQIAQPFQNNLPHHEIAKTLNISSSAVTQYQKKSGEIAVCKGQGQKTPILDTHGFQTLW